MKHKFVVVYFDIVGKDGDEQFTEIVKKAPFSVLVTLICFFSIWSVIGLAGFHTYLTTSDQTTNEDVSFGHAIKTPVALVLIRFYYIFVNN